MSLCIWTMLVCFIVLLFFVCSWCVFSVLVLSRLHFCYTLIRCNSKVHKHLQGLHSFLYSCVVSEIPGKIEYTQTPWRQKRSCIYLKASVGPFCCWTILCSCRRSLINNFLQQGTLNSKQHQIVCSCFGLLWAHAIFLIQGFFATSTSRKGPAISVFSDVEVLALAAQISSGEEIIHVCIGGTKCWPKKLIQSSLTRVSVMHVHAQCSESERA